VYLLSINSSERTRTYCLVIQCNRVPLCRLGNLLLLLPFYRCAQQSLRKTDEKRPSLYYNNNNNNNIIIILSRDKTGWAYQYNIIPQYAVDECFGLTRKQIQDHRRRHHIIYCKFVMLYHLFSTRSR